MNESAPSSSMSAQSTARRLGRPSRYIRIPPDSHPTNIPSAMNRLKVKATDAFVMEPGSKPKLTRTRFLNRDQQNPSSG